VVPRWSIRSATVEDIDSVLALWARAETQPVVGSDGEGLRRLLARDGSSLILAEDHGVPVGTLIAAWDGWRGNFYRLAVDPDHRRAGLATALVREGEQRLAAHGAERLTAIVAEGDPGAYELWVAVGYEPQTGRRRFIHHL
jgi:ribosomal protein S18 acetylase RimI-like enzyme